MNEHTLARQLHGLELVGELTFDEAPRYACAHDMGGVVSLTPGAVLRPASADDVVVTMTRCGEHGIKVAPRGTGASTGGLAQVRGGVVIDVSSLRGVELDSVDETPVVRAEAGALWIDVINATLDRGLMAPVVPFEPEYQSVGGLLASGGLGRSSPDFGAMVDHVRELDVVTGAGVAMTCSPTISPEVFYASAAGLGQVAAITGAVIDVVPLPAETTRIFTLFYSTISDAISDMRRAAGDGRFDWIDGVLGFQRGYAPFLNLPVPTSEDPIYLLRAGRHHRETAVPDYDVLRDLRFIPGQQHISDKPYAEFLNKPSRLIEFLQANGVPGAGPHRMVLIPDAEIDAFAVELVARNRLADVGPFWHIHLLAPLQRSRFRAPLLRLPDEYSWPVNSVWLGTDLDKAVRASDSLYESALEHGGLLYPGLPGHPALSPAQWREHFGAAWAELDRIKTAYDPRNTLRELGATA